MFLMAFKPHTLQPKAAALKFKVQQKQYVAKKIYLKQTLIFKIKLKLLVSTLELANNYLLFSSIFSLKICTNDEIFIN